MSAHQQVGFLRDIHEAEAAGDLIAGKSRAHRHQPGGERSARCRRRAAARSRFIGCQPGGEQTVGVIDE